MIARLRARHRRMWIVAGVALVAILVAALTMRPAEITDADGLEHLRSTAQNASEPSP